MKGKGKDGKQTSAEEILDNAGEKEDEKEDEKEEKRKKHWWERVFLFSSFSSCLLYTSPSPRDRQKSRMPSSA